MPSPVLANWLNAVTGPNIRSGSVDVGRQPNLSFVGAQITVDPLNQQNIVTIEPSGILLYGQGGISISSVPGVSFTISGSITQLSGTGGTTVTQVGGPGNTSWLISSSIGGSGGGSVGGVDGGLYLHTVGGQQVITGSAVTRLVYNPGGTPGGGLFTRWGDISWHANGSQEPVDVYIPANCTTDAGSYVMPANWTLTLAPGVTFLFGVSSSFSTLPQAITSTGIGGVVQGECVSGHSHFSLDSNTPVNITLSNVVLSMRTTGIMCTCAATPNESSNNDCYIILLDAALEKNESWGPVFTFTNSSNVYLFAFDSSFIAAYALGTSPLPGACYAYYDSSTTASNIASSGGSVTYVDQANQVTYAPGTPGNWSPAPTQVAAALDQLASTVHAFTSSVVFANDLTGSSNTQQWVAGISGKGGIGGTVPVLASNLQFAANSNGPAISIPTSLIGSGTNLQIQAQSAKKGSGKSGGGIVIELGASDWVTNTTQGIFAITMPPLSGNIQEGTESLGSLPGGGVMASLFLQFVGGGGIQQMGTQVVFQLGLSGSNSAAAVGNAGQGNNQNVFIGTQYLPTTGAYGGNLTLEPQPGNGSTGGRLHLNGGSAWSGSDFTASGGDIILTPGTGSSGGAAGLIDLENQTIVTSVSNGSHALPANAAGWITVRINGSTQYIPYF